MAARRLDVHLTHSPEVRREVEALVKRLNAKFPGARFTQLSVVQAAITRGLRALKEESMR